jgi:hypothetical protein
MSKQDMIREINLIKMKLMNERLGTLERSELMVALIALYESAIKLKE